MSGALDNLNAQNLTRAQAVFGAAAAANRAFASAEAAGAAGRAALATSSAAALSSALTGGTAGRRTNVGFNIEEFSSRINRMGGLARTTNFLVVIQPPRCMGAPVLTGAQEALSTLGNEPVINELPAVGRSNQEINQIISGAADNLIFLCGAAAIPGVQLQVTDVQPYGYGAIERRPTNAAFNAMRMNYYVDVNSTVYQFFTRWISCIVNFNDAAIGARTVNSAFFNEVSYKEDYATTITIYVYDSTGNNFLEVKLVDAFPIEIGQVNLTWGSYNSVALLPINISYSNWVSNYTPLANISVAGLRNLTLASTLLEAGTLASGASSIIRRPGTVADTFNLVNNASILRSNIFV